MYDKLFSPLDLNGVTIDNRVIRTAHGTLLSRDDLVAYHAARARGGVGLSILESAGLHRTCVMPHLDFFDDSILGFFEQLMKQVRPHGMAMFQQIGHMGSAYPGGSGAELWSASAVPQPTVGIIPHAMSTGMIDEMVARFGSAAGRVKAGGLDGVEIHASHGYLIGQFLSPALNQRDDEYGGSLDNRMRFLVRILDAVRDEVGAAFHVGVRLSSDLIPGGLDIDEVRTIALLIEEGIDHFNISMGSEFHFQKMQDTMEAPLVYELDSSEVVTRSLSTPTMISGRVMGLDDASRVVESGAADMVSMVRALIADPDLVNKARNGRGAEVRPCIGSSQGCIGNMKTIGRMGCVVNPVVGRESSMEFDPTTRSPAPKRVLVVGGGPAGMEAARTAAMRGHDVTLFEKRRTLGGQVSIAAAAPRRFDMAAITSWLETELVRLGVSIRRGVVADLDTVIKHAADEVILATGTEPAQGAPQITHPTGSVPGIEMPHVVTSWDALGFGRTVEYGSTAVVFDDLGTFEAISVALSLVSRGISVTFVTSLDMLGARVPLPVATTGNAREMLMSADFTFIPSAALTSISSTHVTVTSLGTERSIVAAADTVVVVTTHHPNRELGDDLTEAGIRHSSIGAVNGTSELQVAIREGTEVARVI